MITTGIKKIPGPSKSVAHTSERLMGDAEKNCSKKPVCVVIDVHLLWLLKDYTRAYDHTRIDVCRVIIEIPNVIKEIGELEPV